MSGVAQADEEEVWGKVVDFHEGVWRGIARDVCVDGVLKRAKLGDEKSYVTGIRRLKKKRRLEEKIKWDDGKTETLMTVSNLNLNLKFSVFFSDFLIFFSSSIYFLNSPGIDFETTG